MRMMTLLFLVPLTLLLISLTGAQDDSGPLYSGAKRCKKCHIDRFKSWQTDVHSKAFENITEEQAKDSSCLRCHTTGFEEGGFVSVEKSDHLTAVQCEQCHGPGKNHIPLMTKLKKDKAAKAEYPEDKKINRSPAGCIKCHSPHEEHVPIEK